MPFLFEGTGKFRFDRTGKQSKEQQKDWFSLLL